uniref:Doublecortin domain containing 1 n=1 Tax=Varanus komodoensis TaxID=61221 RepID=A0A8D2IPH2_VARKO
ILYDCIFHVTLNQDGFPLLFFFQKEHLTAKKTEEKQRKPLLGPESPLQSTVVSGRSGLQDGSTHQIKSVQRSDGISELVSYKSNSTNNFCLISSSKRNRPASAPPGQLRCQHFPPSKFHLAQKASEVPHIFKQQPQILRVTAYKNGTINIFAKVTVPHSIKLLLEVCTEKLKLNMAARRVFLADGTEAMDAIDIPYDADVYISTGEPFSNPFKKIKDHLLLMKNSTWTLNGLVFPKGGKRRNAKPVLSKRMKNLTQKPAVRLMVFKNGVGQDGYELPTLPDQIEKFLDICTMKLNLTSPAKCLYNMQGEKIEDLINVPLLDKCLQNSITPLRGPLWVSKGEGFSPSGAKMYIQGILLALHQRLKSAKHYCEQLDYVIDGQKDKITDKGILSMKKEELLLEQGKVNTLIDELQAAIKSYKGHLSKLAPQLQAEQEQCASYIYQHIKELSANAVLSQGLQLKVGCLVLHMDIPVQHMIHQRLQHSADFKPSGLSRFPTQLFDETGQEIKNPLLLQNEQKIWVSYGEDYRSPLSPVLSLTFDRVTAAEKDGITVIYKTLLDPTVDLLPGCDNWEACAGFPDNFQFTNHPEHQTLETVDPDSHFIQYKVSIRECLLWEWEGLQLNTSSIRAIGKSSLAVGHPIRVVMQDGILLEGYKLNMQKSVFLLIAVWVFLLCLCPFLQAYPEFVLTYLEELNVREEVTQTEYHTHHGAQSAVHQETDSNSAEEVLQNNVCNCNEKQLSGPLDAHLMPEGPLRENRQLTVALMRKLEEKHPKASAQRWAIKHEGTSKPGQWKQSKVDNPLWNKLTYMWPVLHANRAVYACFPLFKRCTTALHLPFAARRLFTGKGVEIFLLKGLERDQLIYVSCGEQWIDPQWTEAQHKKRLQLSNLASDITAIRAYCIMRNTKNLALGVKNSIAVGAKLTVERITVKFEEEKVAEEPEERQAEENPEKVKDDIDKNSHAKSHLKADAFYKPMKYTWQQISYDLDEDCSLQKEKEEQFFEDAELYKKYRSGIPIFHSLAHNQQFEFRSGKIINCRFPNLVLGVENSDLHSGTEVVLLEKKNDDITQQWIWREASRTFHLVIDPNLVLAVSMPNILNGFPKIPKYKECKNGAANQKWNYTEARKILSAFYSTTLDQEITAANYASVCTFSVASAEKIDQPGYYFLSPCGKQKVMICLACARIIRGKKELKKLLPGTMFFCASGSEEGKHISIWPYKCLNVNKTDLSTSEAESTLQYLEEVLASLKTETSLQIISEKMSAAVNQRAVKIIAYRNGAGYQNGQLIITSTFPMLLSLCTRRLELNRTACRLYTSEGTLILTLQDLILCAVNDYLRKQELGKRDERATSISCPNENASAFLMKEFVSSVITPKSLNLTDDILLNIILRNPVEVWVSCGEPFLPLDTLQKAERQERQKWLKKDKILADLDVMKHKMRQLQGRRITKSKAAILVPTKSPLQPVVVEGGWNEETQEEMKLMETIQHTEMHLSELQALQLKRSSQFSPKLLAKSQRNLYKQPTTKRVWAYINGYTPEQGARVWGKTISELLDSCTTQLKMPQPARTLYTPDGEPLQSWDEIERDMIVCVTTGHPFMSRKGSLWQFQNHRFTALDKCAKYLHCTELFRGG